MGSGRPTILSNDMMDAICERISNGESTKSICDDSGMPSMTTFFRWLRENDDFQQRYARAKEVQLERLADEILDISDDGTNDWQERQLEAGRVETVPDHEHINRSRLRVDSRKWILSKLAPKKYGDKQTLEHTGADGGVIKVGIDDRQLRDLILAVTHDCPACRERAAAKLAELEAGTNGDDQPR